MSQSYLSYSFILLRLYLITAPCLLYIVVLLYDCCPCALLQTLDPDLLFPNPTFSLGLTQEARVLGANNTTLTTTTGLEGGDKENGEGSEQESGDEDISEASEEDEACEENAVINEEGETAEEANGKRCDRVNDVEANISDATTGGRKSKRQKIPPMALLGEYQCDKGFLNRARKASGDPINQGGNTDYAAKFSVLLDKMKTKL